MTIPFHLPEPEQRGFTLPLLRTHMPAWERRRAAPHTHVPVARALRVLGHTGEPTRVGDRLVWRDDHGELEVFDTAGAMRWARRAKEEDAFEAGTVQPALAQAEILKRADAFLEEMHLRDGRARVGSVTRTTATALDEDDTSTLRTVEWHVSYTFLVDGIPVVGPGAKMQTTLSPEGEVTGFYRFWRGAKHESKKKTLRRRQAYTKLRDHRTFGPLQPDASVKIDRVFTAYYAAPIREIQHYLVPIYACEGTTTTPALGSKAFVRYVAAVEIGDSLWKRIGPAARRLVL